MGLDILGEGLLLLNQIRKFVSTITLLVVLSVVALGVYFFLSSKSDSSPAPSAPRVTQNAVVEFVVDGDTVDLTIDGVSERVRLIGIDTPETVNRQTPEQCYGAEASAALRELLPVGTTVRVERDKDIRDRFGRLLLYVYRADDDVFINRWMVENGYATAISYRPNTAFEEEFARIERQATADQLGLWGACDGPDQPLDPETS